MRGIRRRVSHAAALCSRVLYRVVVFLYFYFIFLGFLDGSFIHWRPCHRSGALSRRFPAVVLNQRACAAGSSGRDASAPSEIRSSRFHNVPVDRITIRNTSARTNNRSGGKREKKQKRKQKQNTTKKTQRHIFHIQRVEGSM